MACTPPPAWGEAGLNILEKSLLGRVRNFYFGGGVGGGGNFVGKGHAILK